MGTEGASMTPTTTTRPLPLLADACRCRSTASCLTCRRFIRYLFAVNHRRQARRRQ